MICVRRRGRLAPVDGRPAAPGKRKAAAALTGCRGLRLCRAERRCEVPDDARRQRERADGGGRDEKRSDERDRNRVRAAEQPIDGPRRLTVSLSLLVRELRDEKTVELLLERRDAALDGLQLSPDGDDQRAPVLAK